MRFIDEVKIHVRSGGGGNGCVSFRREKFVPRGGPNGGDGGNGGSVIIIAQSAKLNLLDLKYHPHFKAERGHHGMGSGKHGRKGKNAIVKVPPGTQVKDPDTGELLADLTEKGQEYIAAQGGKGGKGNARFATATNQVPHEAEPGEPEEQRWLLLELKVIADVGIVGFPSVGKSSLIRALSNATPKVAAYPFTTLSPHLGTIQTDEYRQVIFADIPGLIRGASAGQGLGHKFLRHIERTRMIVHLLDLDPHSGRDPYEDYLQINKELEAYDATLIDKPQVVAANKIDLPESQERFEKLKEQFAKIDVNILPISAIEKTNTDELLNQVLTQLDRTPGKLEWEGP